MAAKSRIRLSTLLRATALLLALVCVAFAQDTPAEDGPFVVICPIVTEQGAMIGDDTLILVNHAISQAHGADAIVFIIDTPGGRLDSAVEITKSLLEAPCKTIAYVQGMGAISAGALIGYACDEIAMAPGSNFGASQVVHISADFVNPTVTPAGEKETSFLRSKFKALGEVKGHNPDIGQAMVDQDIELLATPRGDGTFDVKATNPGQSATPEGDSPLEKAVDALEESTDLPLEPLKDIVKELTTDRKGELNQSEEVTQALSQPPPAPGMEGAHIIIGRDKLLTLTPEEAMKYRLIEYMPRDLDHLLRIYELEDARRVEVKLTWSEELYGWLTNPAVAGILLMLGIGGIYVEMKTPGFGLPGTIGIIALALFFGARGVIGLADWIDILLVVVGLALIVVEIFFIPGFGIVGGLGLVSLLAGLFLSFTFTDFSFSLYSWNFDRFRDAGMTVTLTALGLVVMTAALWKVFPHTPLHGWLVLDEEQQVSRGYTVQTESERVAAIGLKGTATSMLRPAGRARFGDKTLLVVSRAEFVEPGTPVQIVEVEGNRYVVDRIKE